MKNLLKLEEATMLLASLWAFQQLDISWWWFAGCLLLPDISMLGYLFGAKAGAYSYNLFHHKGVALGVVLAGLFLDQTIILFTGIILFAHASLDRMLGYGLKYEQGFKFTHLGPIGKETGGSFPAQG